MSLMFDSPLGKKLTESETVIAALVVEDITAWLDEMLSLHHLHVEDIRVPRGKWVWHS